LKYLSAKNEQRNNNGNNNKLTTKEYMRKNIHD
jgi:hypothetical protein